MGISTTNFPQLVSLPTGFLVGINSVTVAEVLYIVTLTSPQYLFAPLGRPRLTEVQRGGGVLFFTSLPQKKVQVGVVVTSIPTKTTQLFFGRENHVGGRRMFVRVFFFFWDVNIVIVGC